MISYRDKEEGKAGVGKLPPNLIDLCRQISDEWSASIPDKSALTYHVWYDSMQPKVKSLVHKLGSDPFFFSLCDPYLHDSAKISAKCRIFPITEMDELYYSNVTEDALNENMFGATSNFKPHKDMYVTIQPGINIYRILIGISEGNREVATVFDKFGAKQYLNRGDFVAFDFSKTTHHVE